MHSIALPPSFETAWQPVYRFTARHRRKTMWSHHARAVPVALSFRPATSRLQSRMSGAPVAVCLRIGMFSWWHQPCRRQRPPFLPRCMECRRGLAMRILSVCPSVCPSVHLSVRQTRGLWQNGRQICLNFYTVRKIIYPSFLRRRMVGGRRPLLP